MSKVNTNHKIIEASIRLNEFSIDIYKTAIFTASTVFAIIASLNDTKNYEDNQLFLLIYPWTLYFLIFTIFTGFLELFVYKMKYRNEIELLQSENDENEWGKSEVKKIIKVRNFTKKFVDVLFVTTSVITSFCLILFAFLKSGIYN